MKLTYSQAELQNLRKSHLVKQLKLKDEVQTKIKTFQIKKPFRGKRAGTKIKNKNQNNTNSVFKSYAECVKANLPTIKGSNISANNQVKDSVPRVSRSRKVIKVNTTLPVY